MQLGNDVFVFKYPVRCKKKFKILIIFIEINVNACLLCAHPVMKSIILHTPRTNIQLRVSYALSFYVSADFGFSHFEDLKSTFSHRSISPPEVWIKECQVLGSQ